METLRDQGFVATTNAGGSEVPWLPEFTEALAGREVLLIPDNDKPGRERAARIARALLGRVTRWPVFKCIWTTTGKVGDGQRAIM